LIPIIRTAVFGFAILTVVYLLVSIYSRSVRREKLEKRWDGEPANEGLPRSERDAFVEAGMQAYRGSLRRRLIVLVYIIPIVVVGLIIYLVDYQ